MIPPPSSILFSYNCHLYPYLLNRTQVISWLESHILNLPISWDKIYLRHHSLHKMVEEKFWIHLKMFPNALRLEWQGLVLYVWRRLVQRLGKYKIQYCMHWEETSLCQKWRKLSENCSLVINPPSPPPPPLISPAL